MRGLAVVAHGYLQRLMDEGMDERSALVLVRDWHYHYLRVTYEPADPERGVSS